MTRKRLTRSLEHLQNDGLRLDRPDRSVLRHAFDGVATPNQIPVPSVPLKPNLRIIRFQQRYRYLSPLKLHLLKRNEMDSIGNPNGHLMLLFSSQQRK